MTQNVSPEMYFMALHSPSKVFCVQVGAVRGDQPISKITG